MIAPLVVAAMAIAAATPGVATGGASTPPRHPVTRLHHGVIQIQGHARMFSYYVPPALPTPSGLVLAFHGGGGTGARLRGFVGASLERMADRFGFMVPIPTGSRATGTDADARGASPRTPGTSTTSDSLGH